MDRKQSADGCATAAASIAATSAPLTLNAPSARFYERKVVRDLLWAFSSPHMIAAARFPVLPTRFGSAGAAAHHHPRVIAWLAALEADPSHLINFLQGTTRSKGKMLALGVYFAALLEYWLRFCPLFRVERFALSKQIVSATNQTIGQLKFLFRLAIDDANAGLSNSTEAQTGKDFHVESSVKFFLLNPLEPRVQANGDDTDQGSEALVHNNASNGDSASSSYYQLEQFVGPHLGENLAWRVQEVARKLDMCQGESVQSWLRGKYSDRVKSHIVLRGYLFYPLSYFASTSEVTQRHDWEFHANPTSRIPTNDEGERTSQASCHPSIAPDHLRGWWTSDIEAEFQQKVLANNNSSSSEDPQQQLGESRFVVLPKLHWLSPIIAIEDTETGEIVIDGESTLGIETLRVISLSELVQYAKHHFHVVAASPDAQANGAVVMPLLISELVCCRPGDLEFDVDMRNNKKRWKELSRGFALDPRYWDPLPLCHDAVRFRRVNNNGKSDVPVGEREYESRRDWVHDGVIKPSDEEIAKTLKSKQHEFANPEAMSPSNVCEELLALFAKDRKHFTHANLKKSICAVFQCQGKREDSSHQDPTELNLVATAEFVLQCLHFLVLGERKHDVKVAQRVGHLVLDAFEAQKGACSSIAGFPVDKHAWQHFFLQIVKRKEKWSYLFLALRASDLICLLSRSGWPIEDENDEVGAVIEDLLSHQNPRWNAIAVETMKVFRLGDRYNSDSGHTEQQQVEVVLDSLMDQEDWKSAEQLAILSNDLELLQIAFKRFSLLNMSKVLKRLRKVLVEYHAKWDLALLNRPEYDGSGPGGPGIHTHTGPPIDHSLNRSLTEAVVTPMAWEFIDSAIQIDTVLEFLETNRKLIRNHDTQDVNPLEAMGRMVIGIDCEWRPKFLSRGAGGLQNEAKTRAAVAASDNDDDDGDDEDLDEEAVDEHEGLSVYQLAVGDKVFVIDVQVLGEVAAKPLRFIWDHASSFTMVGFCVSSDLKRMTHSFPGLLGVSEEKTNLLVELKQFAMYRQLPASKWGLSQLSRICLDDEVDKEQQCSDWGARPLSPSQLEYAAKDAFAVRNIVLHLLADVEINSSSHVIEYLRRFAVVTSPTAASFGHWVSIVQPLNQSHVRSALRDLALERVTSFHRIAKDEENGDWDGSVWTQDGLIVKTIAVLVRSASSAHCQRQGRSTTTPTQYAAVVVQLDKSIDMDALSCVFGVKQDELVLADKETLIRIFGYTRGCVGPVGLREQRVIQVVIDDSLMDEEKLLCGAGEVDVVYAIAPNVLANAVSAVVARVSTM